MSWHRHLFLVYVALVFAAFLLPSAARVPFWLALTALHVLILAWGVFAIRSPLFGRALCENPAVNGVALTYDDGPDEHGTPALLELLARHGVRATFFLVGERARAAPNLVRAIVEAGHELGNHSDGHSHLLNFRRLRGMRRDIAVCQDSLRAITGRAPRYYRPPVGLRNPSVHPACRELGLAVVGWQVRSLDTTSRTVEEVVRRVLVRVRPGGIVLLHDGGQAPERVLAITGGLLRGLEERKLPVVGLGELFGLPTPSAPRQALRSIDPTRANR